MEKITGILKALSDETRLRILNLLYQQELCVCDIVETLGITQAKASRHLIYMKNAGFLKDRKQAQWVYYALQQDHQLKFMDHLVYDQLRNMPVCKADLEMLHARLEEKNRAHGELCSCENKRGQSNNER